MCGKDSLFGNTIKRRGIAKKKGGIGKKTTGISPRRFFPNIQEVRSIVDGKPKRVKICTRCIKQGLAVKG